MNDDFRIDLDDVKLDIMTGEVLCIFFPILRKTLLLDLRTEGGSRPLVRLLPMAGSLEERVRTIARLRPRLPVPERLIIVPWGKYADSLVRLGIWDAVLKRCIMTGDKQSVASCESALLELRALEKAEVYKAIRGENYETIWQAAKPG